MSASVIRPAGAAYSAKSASSVSSSLVQSANRPDKHSHHHHAEDSDEWDHADLRDASKAKKRVFYWEAQGSLRGMSARRHYETPLTTAQAVMYRAASDPPESERKGDPTRAILLDGRILSVTNRFPVTMVLSSNLLRGRTYGAARGDSVERGLLIVPGNRTIDFNDDGRFLLPHPSLTSEVIRRFAKDGHRNLKKECIKLKDTKKYMVPADSPIMYIIEINEPVIRKTWEGFAVRKLPLTDGKYVLPREYVKEAIDVFDKAIKSRMPHVDMTQLTLRLHRYGADWTDAIVDTPDPTINERLLSMHATFSVSIEFTYRLPAPRARV